MRFARFALYALLLAGFAPRAFADDFDNMLLVPRMDGPAGNFVHWGGVYVGGQISYSGTSGDFTNTTQAPIAYALRETGLENEFAPSTWPVLGSASHTGAGYGGFVGFNTQFEHLVLGFEANYDQASLSLLAPNSPISRVTPPDSGGDTYLVNITGSGSVTSLDFATLRGRAGWAVGGFLPYAFAGVAVGHANVNVAATIYGEQNPPTGGGLCSAAATPPCTPYSFSGTAGKNGEWLYGFTVGGGLDFAVTPNFFLRAEYEYVQFAPISSLIIDINTVRLGAGIRF